MNQFDSGLEYMDRLHELMLEKGKLRRLYAAAHGAHARAKAKFESTIKEIKVINDNLYKVKKISNDSYLNACTERDTLISKAKGFRQEMNNKFEEFKQIFIKQRVNLNERRKIIKENVEGQQGEEMQEL